MEELFECSDRVKRTRKSNQAEVKALKAKHEIYTHNAEGCGWLAFSFTECKKRLSGYSVTEEEEAEPMLLYFAYCRLMDEAGMTADGCATEYEAVKLISDRLEMEQARTKTTPITQAHE